jgi:carbonic anhydrase
MKDSSESGRREFCTVVNCMDGRVQDPVGVYCRKRFGVSFVDTVTEAGPSLLLSRRQESEAARSILRRVELSVGEHGSQGVAVVGHHDCAGNPAPMEEQVASLREAVALLQESFSGVEVIALWVDEEWQVREVAARTPGD